LETGRDALQVGVSGYIQPWSEPGPWVADVLDLLDDPGVDIELHLVMPQHWGGARATVNDGHQRLFDHDRTVVHGAMAYRDFRRWIRQMEVSLDVFERNEERELAMVTRTLVALCSGSAVIHPTFTEVSPMIEAHGAGWLVGDEPGGLGPLLRRLATDREDVAARRANTAALAAEVLEPEVATRGLRDLLAVTP
jgi:hypothetical protein